MVPANLVPFARPKRQAQGESPAEIT